jgi:hypothetical protein
MKTRRDFLKALPLAAISLGHPILSSANSFSLLEKFVVTIQAEGGWDVTCFCDPKENQKGEEEITRWSRNKTTQQFGNIKYAPFAKNEHFFKKHAEKMLIINGVDCQTNAHLTGQIVSWSGRTSGGLPSITALNSAVNGPGLPLSYISFGGFSRTERVTRATMLSPQINELKQLLASNVTGQGPIVNADIWGLIREINISDARDYLAQEKLIGGNVRLGRAYLESLLGTDEIRELADKLPDEGNGGFSQDELLKQQAFFAVKAFQSGLSASADLNVMSNFDSHDNNDTEQADSLSVLTEGIDYLWDAAEEAGIADRLFVVVGSDFSRTPFYNSAEGKDHWPYGSYMIMEKGANFTNRVIGGTDERQFGLKVDPSTLELSNSGSRILPSHVHSAMRSYLGLDSSELVIPFALNDTEKFNFFS